MKVFSIQNGAMLATNFLWNNWIVCAKTTEMRQMLMIMPSSTEC